MSSFSKKVKFVIKNPKKAIVYLYKTTRNSLLRKKFSWSEKSGFRKKEYKDYAEYLEHQKSKLDKVELRDYDIKYREALRERLQQNNLIKPGMSVLCLAARLGTEVKSFIDLGCFAIGIDLNPGNNNEHVVVGDFHNIQYADNNVDVIFCNSLDHTYDFTKLIKEIKRVLKKDGLLVLEIVKGEEEGLDPGYYEASYWGKIDDVLEIFENSGFKIFKKMDFEYPWQGQHTYLKLN